MREIIPLYRRLMEREQIELSTTPFFHPILPLLIDTDFTHRARPDLPLPSRFHAPDDAEAQLQRAVEFHTATFGRAPVGLWPSEGSVCPELIPMLPKVGLRWLATDEGILARSLDAAQQPWQRHRDLYQPTGRAGGPRRHDLFRDREISDAFGSSTTRPLLIWPPRMCFAGCAISFTKRRRNRSPSRSRSTGKIHGSTTTRVANSFFAPLQGLLDRRA